MHKISEYIRRAENYCVRKPQVILIAGIVLAIVSVILLYAGVHQYVKSSEECRKIGAAMIIPGCITIGPSTWLTTFGTYLLIKKIFGKETATMPQADIGDAQL